MKGLRQVLELAGSALVAAAGYMVHPALGVALAGVILVVWANYGGER